MPVPAFALRLAFGEMAAEMLLGGQRAAPDRALALGYRLAFSELDSALGDLLRTVRSPTRPPFPS